MAIFEGFREKIEKINCERHVRFKGLIDAKAICVTWVWTAFASFADSAIALKRCWHTPSARHSHQAGVKTRTQAAEAIGLGPGFFCIRVRLRYQREVGLGHGNLGLMLLREESCCFCSRRSESFPCGRRNRHRKTAQQGSHQAVRSSSTPRQGRGVCHLRTTVILFERI
jgi:hypothetical protein